jgi:hypothetical protein
VLATRTTLSTLIDNNFLQIITITIIKITTTKITTIVTVTAIEITITIKTLTEMSMYLHELEMEPESESEADNVKPVMALRTVTHIPLKKSMACQTESNFSSSHRDNVQYGVQQPTMYSQPSNIPVSGFIQPQNLFFLQNPSPFDIPMPHLVPIIPNPSLTQPQFQQSPVVNSYVQPPINQGRGPLQCHNCKKFGHRFRDCRQPKSRVFCYKCGMENVTTENCPFCKAGNGQ